MKLLTLILLSCTIAANEPRKYLSVKASDWRAYDRHMQFENPRAQRYGFIQDLPTSKEPDPKAGPDWIGYVVSDSPIDFSRYKSITFKIAIKVSEGAKVNHQSESINIDRTPASIGMLLMTGQWGYSQKQNRWFSDARVPIKQTTPIVVLTAPLKSESWSGVQGERDEKDFNEALKRITFFGLTLGGGYFKGHGVNVSDGSASFNVILCYVE